MGLETDSAFVAWLAGNGPLGSVLSLMRHEQYLGLEISTGAPAPARLRRPGGGTRRRGTCMSAGECHRT